MSKIEVDKVDPQSGTALEIGTSGDTVTVPSGVGLTLTDSTLLLPTTVTATTEVKTNKISPATGVAFALGDSGDTFTVPSGATIVNSGTATGFGGGKIGQVVQTVKTDTTSATSIEVFVDITGMTRAITPTATSSKVLIEVTLAIGLPNNTMLNILLLNGTTGIFLGDAASNRTQSSAYVRGPTDATHGAYNVSFAYIDSPSSTSEVTYKLQWHSNTATYYLNRTEQDDDYVRYPRTASSIICSEILV